MKAYRLGISLISIGIGGLLVTMNSCMSKQTSPQHSQFVDKINSVNDVVQFFPQNAADIQERTADYLEESRADIQKLIAIQAGDRTWANTMQELDRISSLSNLSIWGSMMYLLSR